MKAGNKFLNGRKRTQEITLQATKRQRTISTDSWRSR